MKTQYRIEAMSEILEEIGITATEDQIKKIVEDFSTCIEMESEVNFYQHSGKSEDCSKCKQLQNDLNVVKKERDVYHDSVLKRRNASSVWIEDNEVKYS